MRYAIQANSWRASGVKRNKNEWKGGVGRRRGVRRAYMRGCARKIAVEVVVCARRERKRWVRRGVASVCDRARCYRRWRWEKNKNEDPDVKARSRGRDPLCVERGV